jgi:cytochrome c oxidase subunit III
MSDQHSSYFVPEYSALPIIGSIGLLFFALGTLNVTSLWGASFSILGALILVFMLASWFRSIIKENRAGLYSTQMDRTFRWGLFWFLFTEFFFFATLTGALITLRFFSIPFYAGAVNSSASLLTHYLIWPNFKSTWPLLVNPSTVFSGAKEAAFGWGLPFLYTLILTLSGALTTLSLIANKRGMKLASVTGLLLSIILGISFLFLQFQFSSGLVRQGLTIGSGIYGSLFFVLIGFHTLHVIVGLIILSIVLIRCAAGHFANGKDFTFETAAWFWGFICIVWLVIYILLFSF